MGDKSREDFSNRVAAALFPRHGVLFPKRRRIDHLVRRENARGVGPAEGPVELLAMANSSASTMYA